MEAKTVVTSTRGARLALAPWSKHLSMEAGQWSTCSVWRGCTLLDGSPIALWFPGGFHSCSGHRLNNVEWSTVIVIPLKKITFGATAIRSSAWPPRAQDIRLIGVLVLHQACISTGVLVAQPLLSRGEKIDRTEAETSLCRSPWALPH